MSEQTGFPEVRALNDGEADSLYAGLVLPPGDGRPHIVTNTVVSLDGKTVFEGRSTPLGSHFDRELMRRLRAAADAVIMGAGTLRAEEIEFRLPTGLLAGRLARGLPPYQTVVIVSARGDLPLERRLFSLPTDDLRPVVVTTRAAEARVRSTVPTRVTVLAHGETTVDLPEAMAALRRTLGIRHAILEGGPSLNAAMLAEGLIDEVMFTLSPKIVGGPALTMVAGPAPLAGGIRAVRLVSALAYGDELFLRYVVQRSEG